MSNFMDKLSGTIRKDKIQQTVTQVMGIYSSIFKPFSAAFTDGDHFVLRSAEKRKQYSELGMGNKMMGWLVGVGGYPYSVLHLMVKTFIFM